MVVRHLTDVKTQGFYVDIGAFHPVYLSNTYHFYCKGWQGINIDGRPKSMELFQVLRPKDINLEICLSSEEKDVTFFSFEQSPYDTINPSVAEEVINEKKIKLLNKFSMKSRTLESVLEEYLPDGKKIDLMNI
ncbi:MAG: FkbM family methyltransferase, partial [Dolichospermum sp.]